MSTAPKIQELQSKIYPNLEENYKKSDWLRDWTILASRNDIVKQINATLMAKMPGESVVYRSYDQTTEVSEASGYPMEVLNNQNPPGLPPHEPWPDVRGVLKMWLPEKPLHLRQRNKGQKHCLSTSHPVKAVKAEPQRKLKLKQVIISVKSTVISMRYLKK